MLRVMLLVHLGPFSAVKAGQNQKVSFRNRGKKSNNTWYVGLKQTGGDTFH